MSLNAILKPLDTTFQRGEDPLLLGNNSSVHIISGRRGSGKSTLLLCLLQSKKAYRHRFDNVFLVSPTAASDSKFERLVRELEGDGKFFQKFDDTAMESIFGQIQADNEAGKRQKKPVKPLHCIILDDCIMQLPKSRTSLLDNVVIQSRHHNVSLLVTTQKWNMISRTIRANCDIISTFGSVNRKEIESLQDDINISPEVFSRIYRYATSEPNSFLHCNLLSFPPRFYKCFERINVNLQTGDIEDIEEE